MITYTTCRGCGNLCQITDGLNHHGDPACTPKPTRADIIGADYITAILNGNTDAEAECAAALEAIRNQPPRLLDAALAYASWGWPVFPLLPLSRAQLDPQPDKAAKRPATRHGFKDATTDPERIRAWWTRHPDSNIGLPTGIRFDVIDIDVPNGIPHLLELLGPNAHGEIHGHAVTASGGAHLYIPATGRGNTASPTHGVDYRGAGGYVVAPPSTLGQPGRSWSWVHRPSPLLTGVGDTYGR